MTLFHHALRNFWNCEPERALSSFGLFTQVCWPVDEKSSWPRELPGAGAMAAAVTVGKEPSWIPRVLYRLSWASTWLLRREASAGVSYLMLFRGNEWPLAIWIQCMDEELAGGCRRVWMWKFSDFFTEHVLVILTVLVAPAALREKTWQEQSKGRKYFF